MNRTNNNNNNEKEKEKNRSMYYHAETAHRSFNNTCLRALRISVGQDHYFVTRALERDRVGVGKSMVNPCGLE